MAFISDMARRKQGVAGKRARSKTTRGAGGSAFPPHWPSRESLVVAVYDWNVHEDRLQGDGHLAQLFSRQPEELSNGLPFADFMRAVHPDDVKNIEDIVAAAVEKQDSISVSYRVRDGHAWKHVNALGRCYQNNDGDLRFSGVVVAGGKDQPPLEASVELPPRETECLTWCSEGKTNWEIGRILGISERTVEHHIASAVRRLGCSSRVQAVALSLRLGLIK